MWHSYFLGTISSSQKEGESLWKIENYEEFLTARRQILAKNINEFLISLAVEKEEEYGSATLEELISEGESEELEFKSSLRWDYQQGTVNKKLGLVIMKTVAAFGNSDGGSLIIGIDDNAQALGLENDYASLKGDKDRFELHLRNLLNQSFGAAYTASNVKIYFPLINEIEICQVDVSPSKEPLVLIVKDKNGVDSEKLYVRSGNSSHELSISEFNNYRKERFD